MKFNIKRFYKQCLRVWHVLRKPTKEEFLTIAKVSTIGVLILGLVGFIISITVKFLLRNFYGS